MLICGAFAGLAGAIDILGWQFAVATNDIQNAGVVGAGFIGIAVALLGRNTTTGVLFSALLFGALQNGTSVRNLDPEVFPPELATNLTLIIQGLIVLLVSAPVIVTGAVQAAARGGRGPMKRRRRAREHRVARPAGRILAASSARCSRAGRRSRSAIFAFWLALPPLLVRTPVPSLAARRWPRSASACGRCARASGGSAGERSSARRAVRDRRDRRHAVGRDEPRARRRLVRARRRDAAVRHAARSSRALGGVISERSGVVNIGLEGMMLVGAFFGIYGADLTDGWIGGPAASGCSPAACSRSCTRSSPSRSAPTRSSPASRSTSSRSGSPATSSSTTTATRAPPTACPQVPDVTLPIDWIPFFGPALDKLNLLVWVALLLVIVVWLFVFRTPAGLRLRSVGENPRAAATVGISVYKVRYLAVIASGVLAAMGGAFLSIGFVHSFNQNMTAGRGFIALAVVIVGKWRPGAALAAALMFGFSQALAQRLAVFSESSGTLLQALPYVVTLIAVAGLVGRSTPPAADGVPYSKE